MENKSKMLSSCPQAKCSIHSEHEHGEWQGFTIHISDDEAHPLPASAYMPVPDRGWAQ